MRKEDGEDKGRISTLELREIKGSVVLEVLGRLAMPSGVALLAISVPLILTYGAHSRR